MVHEVNTRTFYPSEGVLHSQRRGRVQRETPLHLRVDGQSLFWALPVDGENVDFIQAHVLPKLSIQVARFGWKEHVRTRHRCDFYVDILKLTECSASRWHLRDLYLDLVVFEGERAEVLDTDEYLAAIAAGYLSFEEAAPALTSLHHLMNGLAEHAYRLESYLAANGIRLDWV